MIHVQTLDVVSEAPSTSAGHKVKDVPDFPKTVLI